MSDRLTIERDGGVADVRLNRPDKMNAVDMAMFEALVEVADDLASDTSLRCVVLSGEGKAFCAGLDFSGFSRMRDSADGDSNSTDSNSADKSSPGDPMEGRITHRAQQAVYGWTTLPVPVIAAVNGHALGAGAQLALGADIRIVHPEAKISVLEIRWGLIPDMTGTQTLINLVGLDVAKELTFTGRMVPGTEAKELGLATRLSDDPRSDALAMATEIASKSPDAIRAGKRLLNSASKVGLADGFAAERTEISALVGSPNQVEQITAFFEKREPNFTNPAN